MELTRETKRGATQLHTPRHKRQVNPLTAQLSHFSSQKALAASFQFQKKF